MELWRITNRAKAHFAQIRERARARFIPFTITFEYFLEIIEGTGYLDARGRQCGSLHLDRKDALEGYIPGNLQVLTVEENCQKAQQDKERRRAFIVSKLGYDPFAGKAETDPDPDYYDSEPYPEEIRNDEATHHPDENTPF